jgi:Family of unknown function (DUF6187)
MADTRFSLPAVDDPASTEAGVILMGLDASALLAGLGLAALAEDATAVTLLVDQVRHGGEVRLTRDHLITVGAHRWRAERDALKEGVSTRPAPLRQAWARAYQTVLDRHPGAPALTAYLAACLLRNDEMERSSSGGGR